MVLALAAACQDGDGDGDDETTTTVTAADDGTSGLPSSGPATDPAGDDTSTGQIGDDTSGDTADTTDGADTGIDDDSQWGALVIGNLVTANLRQAQEIHDAIAMNGEPIAADLGDIGHLPMLGTSLLGTTMDEFVAIDRWLDIEGALTLYGDPKFGEAFGMLFARPPSLELFEHRSDWYGWGDLDAGAGGDRWFVIVRGTLAERDRSASQQLHDMLAMGGEADATALGDVAHVVWLGSDHPGSVAGTEFFAVDVWTDDSSIEAFYGDPDFQAAFGSLFAEPPRVRVMRSTDWYGW